MKKIFRSSLLFAACAMAVMSCAKNEIDDLQSPEGGYSYKFSLTNDDTKAALGDDSIEYESGDALGIFVGATANASAAVDVAASPVTVSVKASQALKAGDVVYAYYPYAADNASVSAVAMSIPASQTQKAAAFDADAMPMVSVPYTVAGAVEANAATAVGDLYMNNLGAVIEFGIYGADQAGHKIHSVTFTSETALAGNFTYDLTSSDLAISGLTGKSVKTVVNSSLAVGADKAGATKVYMVVAPGSHKGSIAIRTEDATYTVAVETAIAFNRSRVRPININLANAERVAEVKLEWLCTGLGQIRCNMPAVDNSGNVYINSARGPARLYKIDSNGTLAWTFDLGITEDNNTSPSVEPDGSVVYAGGGSSGTGCYYAIKSDGTQKWKFGTEKFFGNGATPKPNFSQAMAVIGSNNIYIGNTGTTGTVLSINKTTGARVAYVSGGADGSGGPAGGVQSGLGMSKDGFLAWHSGYGTFVADQSELDNPTRQHTTYGGYAPHCYRYGYKWNSGQPWKGGVKNGVAFLSIDGKNYVAAGGIELTTSSTYNMRIFCAPVGETTSTWPELAQSWKGIYSLNGIQNQDQGGIVIGPQNEIIVSLKHKDNASQGGIAAVSTDDFTLLYRFNTGIDVAGTPAVDAAGNIHLVTDNPGMYYIIKPDYINKTATVVKEISLYELAVAAGCDLGSANDVRAWSSIAINGDGKIYLALTFHNNWNDLNGAVICLSYEGCTGPGNTPWPMKGADAARTGIQK